MTAMTKPVDDASKLAIIIGIDSYRSEGLEDLPSCKKDAEDLCKLLSDLGYTIFGNEPIIGSKLEGPNAYTNVHRAIVDFFDGAEPGQTLIFYFSGHGIPREDELYLGMPEVKPKNPMVEGFSLSNLTRLMNSSKSMKIVSIIDACYSGSANLPDSRWKAKAAEETAGRALATYDRVLDNIPKSEGRCFLLSSQAYESSLAIPNSNSLYTKYLVEGLSGAEPTTDEKGRKIPASVDDYGNVTPETLHKYVYYKVANQVRQVPKIKFEKASEIILAEHPNLVKTPPSGPSVDVSWLIEDGKQYFVSKDYENALKLFNNAIAQNPRSAVAYFYNGAVFYKLQKYEEAIKSYNKALEIKPKYFDVLRDKGLSLEDLKRYDEAAKCFDEADKIKPNDPKILKYKERIELMISKPSDTSNIVSLEKDNNSVELKDANWYELVGSIYKQNCVAFIGPKACAPWIPSNIVIAKKWAEEYGYPLEDSHQLSSVAQFLAIKNGNIIYPKHLLSRELEKIDPPDFSLEEFNNTPYAVLADLNLPIYITTNYDHFIEEALRSRGKEPISDFCRWNNYAIAAGIPSVFDKDHRSKITPSNPLVYHLYGDMDYPQSMVLTESDYRDFVININNMDEKYTLPLVIRMALSRSYSLFIGYSLEELNFRSISLILTRSGYKGGILVQVPPFQFKNREEILSYLGQLAKDVFKVDLYWGDISDFVTGLRQHLDKFKKREGVSSAPVV